MKLLKTRQAPTLRVIDGNPGTRRYSRISPAEDMSPGAIAEIATRANHHLAIEVSKGQARGEALATPFLSSFGEGHDVVAIAGEYRDPALLDWRVAKAISKSKSVAAHGRGQARATVVQAASNWGGAEGENTSSVL